MSEKRVSFTSMRDGTAADYELIAENDRRTDRQLADRILDHLRMQEFDDGAYRVSRLTHVLQTATRASRDDADVDWVVGALLHDVGDLLAPHTHGQVAYEILRPFVREEVAWVVRHHGAFQQYYNVSLPESQRLSRERFSDQPYYQAAIDFCERWDQASFDPEYPTEGLEFFEPLVREVFAREPFRRLSTDQ